jgi:hypothetical protein
MASPIAAASGGYRSTGGFGKVSWAAHAGVGASPPNTKANNRGRLRDSFVEL